MRKCGAYAGDMSDHFAVVFTGLAIQAEVMRASLEAAGIEAFLKDEVMALIAPGAGVVKVLVRAADEDEARALLSSANPEGTELNR